MIRRRLAMAVAIALVALVAAPRHAAAAPRKGPRHRANMPPGWIWPASRAMRADGKRCRKELTAMGVVWKRAPRQRKIAAPIYVPGMVLGGVKLTPTFRKGPFVMDCHLALSLARAGEVMTQIGVRELRFSTIHEYRQIRLRGAKRHPLSRHALGLAIDVFEVVLEDGQKAVVEKDYRKKEPTLLALERGIAASLDFRTPLTPGNDPRSHYNHFHLEARVDYEEQPIRTAMTTTRAGRRR
ncbi:MAG TPA: extensin family protein [Kofleriaceae bacterium]|nr:extensin family protein [Kofleriaceae bacterium]